MIGACSAAAGGVGAGCCLVQVQAVQQRQLLTILTFPLAALSRLPPVLLPYLPSYSPPSLYQPHTLSSMAAAAAAAAGGAGGGGAAAAGELDVFAAAVPDAANTLGGLHDDKDPDHPSVIAHMGTLVVAGGAGVVVLWRGGRVEKRQLGKWACW